MHNILSLHVTSLKSRLAIRYPLTITIVQYIFLTNHINNFITLVIYLLQMIVRLQNYMQVEVLWGGLKKKKDNPSPTQPQLWQMQKCNVEIKCTSVLCFNILIWLLHQTTIESNLHFILEINTALFILTLYWQKISWPNFLNQKVKRTFKDPKLYRVISLKLIMSALIIQIPHCNTLPILRSWIYPL